MGILENGLDSIRNGAKQLFDSPIASAASGALVGGALVGTALAVSSRTSKKRRKTRKKKSAKRRKSRRKKGRRYTPHTAGKGRDRSTKRIRYTKNGQPYVILRNGRARFIKASSARRSHKKKGGRY